MKISDMQYKTVININDGKEIGRITDLEIDDKGLIINYYATPKRRLFNIFTSNKETVFKTSDIKKIGKDVILVQLD